MPTGWQPDGAWWRPTGSPYIRQTGNGLAWVRVRWNGSAWEPAKVGKIRVALVLAVGAVGIIGFAAAAAGISIGANDDPFTVTIRNNTSQTVIDYGYFVTMPGTSNGGGAVVLGPGQSFGESEFANEGVDQDRITSVGGKTLGCLPFQFSENPPVPFEVNVTEMVPCRNWGDSESKVDATFRRVYEFLDLPYHPLPLRPRRDVGHYAPMEVATRERLQEYFRPHNKHLAQLLDIDLGWGN